MAYVSIAASKTDADSVVDQDLMDTIRLDLDDLNTRLLIVQAKSDDEIFDDFTADNFHGSTGSGVGTTDTQPYTWDTAAGASLSANPDHYVNLSSNTPTPIGIIAASGYKMRFDLDRDHTVVFEARIKGTAAGDQDVLLGFQDAALTALSVANNTDVSDMVGFVRGTNSNTVKFRTARASSADVSDNLGDWSNWMTLKIAITYAGATQEIRAYTGTTQLNYVEVAGSPFTTTTKHPNVRLRPWLGSTGGSGARNTFIDYALYYWNARPLSA